MNESIAGREPDNMSNVGAESNVQLQHISTVDMNICTSATEDNDDDKTNGSDETDGGSGY